MQVFSRIISVSMGANMLKASRTVLRTPKAGACMTGWSRAQQLSVRCDSSFAPAATAISPTVNAAAIQKQVASETVKSAVTTAEPGTRGALRAADDFPYELKHLKLRTCVELYRQQCIEGGRDVPLNGIDLEVGYIDTGFPRDSHGDIRKDCPTVLCLHGAGGNHKDLAVVIKSLAAKGARVIAPNFPGHPGTDLDAEGVYTLSTIENCYFILDFLKTLGINRLDMIAAFSCGCYTAVPLAAKSGLQVGSLALLQIPGHRPYRSIRPLWLVKCGVRLFTIPLVRKYLAPLGLRFVKSLGFMHLDDVEMAYTMAMVSLGVPFDGYRRVASELPFHRIPLTITFSEDDRFMDPDISYEFADLVGLSKDRLTYVNGQGHVEKAGKPINTPEAYLKGVVFRKGGHYVQRKDRTATVLKKTVDDLYDHINRHRVQLASTLTPFREDAVNFRHVKALKAYNRP